VNARINEIDTTPGAALRNVQQRSRDGVRNLRDVVATEMPVALHYNDASFAVLMATPCDLADLALGFSLSEALVADAGELRIEAIDETLDGIAIRMRIPEERSAALTERGRNLPGYGGCGVCGSADIEGVLRAPPRIDGDCRIGEAALHRALATLHERQPLNAATGATHAAAFADSDGTLRLVREDVGRHNALDKLIGAMTTADLAPGDGFVVVTSRASFELAMKAAQARIPVLAAISAPTTLAIAVAESAGLCLVGFARERQARNQALHRAGWRLGRAEVRQHAPVAAGHPGAGRDHAAARQPARRLRLPRLRLARSRARVHLRVLRERREGRRVRGDVATRRPGFLHEVQRRGTGALQRSLARGPGSAHASDALQPGDRSLRGGVVE